MFFLPTVLYNFLFLQAATPCFGCSRQEEIRAQPDVTGSFRAVKVCHHCTRKGTQTLNFLRDFCCHYSRISSGRRAAVITRSLSQCDSHGNPVLLQEPGFFDQSGLRRVQIVHHHVDCMMSAVRELLLRHGRDTGSHHLVRRHATVKLLSSLLHTVYGEGEGRLRRPPAWW